jgi:hypothetical protein
MITRVEDVIERTIDGRQTERRAAAVESCRAARRRRRPCGLPQQPVDPRRQRLHADRRRRRRARGTAHGQKAKLAWGTSRQSATDAVTICAPAPTMTSALSLARATGSNMRAV